MPSFFNSTVWLIQFYLHSEDIKIYLGGEGHQVLVLDRKGSQVANPYPPLYMPVWGVRAREAKWLWPKTMRLIGRSAGAKVKFLHNTVLYFLTHICDPANLHE